MSIVCLLWALLPAQTESEKLRAIFEEEHRTYLREYPVQAVVNYGRQPGPARLTDYSAEALSRRRDAASRRLVELREIRREALSPADRINYDVALFDAERRVEDGRFPSDLLSISNRFQSPASYVPEMFERAPAENAEDYRTLIAWLRGVPTMLAQRQALLERGLAAGLTQPDVAVSAVPGQIDRLTSAPPEKSTMLEPFRRIPTTIPEAERQSLAKEAASIYDGQIVPALRKFRAFMAEKYLPAARKTIAMTALPDGAAWYAAEIRAETTTSLTPAEIHAIGQAEVKRIRAAMDATMRAAKFEGSMAEFQHFLRTDPRFYFTNADDLVAAYRDLCKRIDPQLPRLFGRLPRTPYGVRPVPEVTAPSSAGAFYTRPGGTQPGWFNANTYKIESRPKYEMEATALHEAVPGHHLQLALQAEMPAAPPFRARMRVAAFSEGWGLYAESLGEELGFYKDPYSKFGQLSMEMWRACRLVVDTGMHALGWSRQQAIDFLKAHTALTDQNITAEVDRYIDTPAQALSYKIGELKFKELRKLAETELGARFDIRAFHDAVLANGSIPLTVLEAEVRRWIQERKSK